MTSTRRGVQGDAVSWKRGIGVVHLYLGVGLAVLFVMWFISGVVLVFNPYPSITPDERMRLLPALACERCTVSVDDALHLAAIEVTPISRSTARLGMLGARPVWRVTDGKRRVQAVYADSGRVVSPLDSVSGAAIAAAVGIGRAGHQGAASRAARAVVWCAEQRLRHDPSPGRVDGGREEPNRSEGDAVRAARGPRLLAHAIG